MAEMVLGMDLGMGMAFKMAMVMGMKPEPWQIAWHFQMLLLESCVAKMVKHFVHMKSLRKELGLW